MLTNPQSSMEKAVELIKAELVRRGYELPDVSGEVRDSKRTGDVVDPIRIVVTWIWDEKYKVHQVWSARYHAFPGCAPRSITEARYYVNCMVSDLKDIIPLIDAEDAT